MALIRTLKFLVPGLLLAFCQVATGIAQEPPPPPPAGDEAVESPAQEGIAENPGTDQPEASGEPESSGEEDALLADPFADRDEEGPSGR